MFAPQNQTFKHTNAYSHPNGYQLVSHYPMARLLQVIFSLPICKERCIVSKPRP